VARATSFLWQKKFPEYFFQAPPQHLPDDASFTLRDCHGAEQPFRPTGPFALLFLDADSDFSGSLVLLDIYPIVLR